MKEEEDEVLPAFAARVAADELAELGEKFERAKGRVPTRCGWGWGVGRGGACGQRLPKR
jgi:hypothetical protein